MNFYIISEPNFSTSRWYKSIVLGIAQLQQEKRINTNFLSDIFELKNITIYSDDALLIIGSENKWITSVITIAPQEFDNRIIVLADYRHYVIGRSFSVISSDIAKILVSFYSYLNMHGKEKIALYGINPLSTSDLLKKETFLQCGGNEKDCFYNHLSLEDCFTSFEKQLSSYDGIICANDYAAISLVKHKSLPKSLFITSFGDTFISTVFSPSITCSRTNFKNFGNSLYDLVKILQKYKSINSLSIYLEYSFVIGETTSFLPFPKSVISVSPTPIPSFIKNIDTNFYSDPESNEMLKIDKMLMNCDSIDMLLIGQLLNGFSFTKISEALFVSSSTVKYRIKQLYKYCEVETKTEFIDLLNKYITINLPKEQ